MSIIAKVGSSTPRELTPSGSHIARCYEMIHLGTSVEMFQGENKIRNKVRLTFELPNEMRVFKEENGEQPMVISKEYTLSMHEKANLRLDLESWRGQAFTEKEAEEFDITKLLGIACMLSIVHVTSKNGKEYANIKNISGVPKGMPVPAQINPSFEFNYEDKFDTNYVDGLHKYLKEKIHASDEWKAKTDAMNGAEEEKKMEAQDLQPSGNEPITDDLPF